MIDIKEDAKKVTSTVREYLIDLIRYSNMTDKGLEDAYKAFAILGGRLTEGQTETYLKSMEYFGHLNIAVKAVVVDYLTDTEVRISNSLKAATILVDEFVNDKNFTGEDQFLQSLFKYCSDDVRVACDNFLTQYAYLKTKNMRETAFLMSKIAPMRG